MKAQILQMLEDHGIDRKKVIFFDDLKPKTEKVKVSKDKRPDAAAVENMVNGLPRLLQSLSDRQLPSWKKKALTLLEVSTRELNLVKEGRPAFDFDDPDLPLMDALIAELDDRGQTDLHRRDLANNWSKWTRSEKEKRLLDAFQFGVEMRKKQHRVNDLFHALTKKLHSSSA